MNQCCLVCWQRSSLRSLILDSRFELLWEIGGAALPQLVHHAIFGTLDGVGMMVGVSPVVVVSSVVRLAGVAAENARAGVRPGDGRLLGAFRADFFGPVHLSLWTGLGVMRIGEAGGAHFDHDLLSYGVLAAAKVHLSSAAVWLPVLPDDRPNVKKHICLSVGALEIGHNFTTMKLFRIFR